MRFEIRALTVASRVAATVAGRQHRRLCIHAVVCMKHHAAGFGIFCEFCVVFPCEIFVGDRYKKPVIPPLFSFGKIVDFSLLSASNAAENLTWRWHHGLLSGFRWKHATALGRTASVFLEYRLPSRSDTLLAFRLHSRVYLRDGNRVDLCRTHRSCPRSTSGCAAREMRKLDLSKFDGSQFPRSLLATNGTFCAAATRFASSLPNFRRREQRCQWLESSVDSFHLLRVESQNSCNTEESVRVRLRANLLQLARAGYGSYSVTYLQAPRLSIKTRTFIAENNFIYPRGTLLPGGRTKYFLPIKTMIYWKWTFRVHCRMLTISFAVCLKYTFCLLQFFPHPAIIFHPSFW